MSTKRPGIVRRAFSLVEMLIALTISSLLLSACLGARYLVQGVRNDIAASGH